jgi:hypothetical protein
LEVQVDRALIILAVGVVLLGVIAIVRRLRSGAVPDYLPPEAMTRINTEYSELRQ